VNKPKFHHQWKPDHIDVEEKEFSPETLNRLRAMGYTLKDRTIGRVELILVNGKKIEAVGDKRGDDSAAGY
jgi:gamma-glutamyltranspeptidase/glutathione hydrolase